MIKLIKHNSDFDMIKWVLKAVAQKEKQREALKYLLITSDSFVGCDNIRLHIYKQPPEFPPGLYEIIKNTKSQILLELSDIDIASYPKYQKVIPYYSKYLRLSPKYHTRGLHAYITRQVHSDRGYDFNFFVDLVDISVDYDLRYSPKKESLLVLEGSSALGVLMPFHID